MAWRLELETLRHAPEVRGSCVSSYSAERPGAASPRPSKVPRDAACCSRRPEAAHEEATRRLRASRSVFEDERTVRYRNEALPTQSWG